MQSRSIHSMFSIYKRFAEPQDSGIFQIWHKGTAEYIFMTKVKILRIHHNSPPSVPTASTHPYGCGFPVYLGGCGLPGWNAVGNPPGKIASSPPFGFPVFIFPPSLYFIAAAMISLVKV